MKVLDIKSKVKNPGLEKISVSINLAKINCALKAFKTRFRFMQIAIQFASVMTHLESKCQFISPLIKGHLFPFAR